MYKKGRKFIAVAAIAVLLSTPSLAQVRNCNIICLRAYQGCLKFATDEYSRSDCLDAYRICREECPLSQ
jgi:hypothetical protein